MDFTLSSVRVPALACAGIYELNNSQLPVANYLGMASCNSGILILKKKRHLIDWFCASIPSMVPYRAIMEGCATIKLLLKSTLWVF